MKRVGGNRCLSLIYRSECMGVQPKPRSSIAFTPLSCRCVPFAACSMQVICLVVKLNLQSYLVTVQSHPTPAVGCFNLLTVLFAPHSCMQYYFSASCHSFTHLAASVVASSLMGTLVSFLGSPCFLCYTRESIFTLWAISRRISALVIGALAC